jgi:hypothetical protein
MFVRRIIDHLLNQVLVEGLANSRWFQRFAVWSHKTYQELQVKGKDHSAKLDTHVSSEGTSDVAIAELTSLP